MCVWGGQIIKDDFLEVVISFELGFERGIVYDCRDEWYHP